MSNSTTGSGEDGDVVGPASSTDNAVARWDGTDGKLLQDSGIIVDDSDNMTGVNSITLTTDLAVADGGTGASTLTGVLTGNGTSAVTAATVTEYGVLVGGASNAVASTAVGTAAQVLTSNGAGVAPTFQAAGGGGYDVSDFSGGKIYVNDDFLTTSSDGALKWTKATASGGDVQPTQQSGHIGVLMLRRLTNAVASSLLYLNNVWYQPMAVKFGFYVNVPTLPDATDRFDVEVGVANIVASATTIADGVYMRYVDDENSGNWQIISINNSTSTISDSGIAADTNWVYLEIEANADWSSISYYINGTETSNSPITTNIPTSTDGMRFFIRIVGTDGTASRFFYIDKFYFITNP